MAESNSFSKLSDLIDSHLSNIQESSSGNKIDELIRNAYAMDERGSPGYDIIQPVNRRVVLPNLNLSRNENPSPILNVMAKQVSNAIKVRELNNNQVDMDKYKTKNSKQKDDKQKDDELIDLMKCLTVPHISPNLPRRNSGEDEYDDFKKVFLMEDIHNVHKKQLDLNHEKLRCVLRDSYNMSKIKLKRKRAHCSSLGKAICARFVQFYEPCLLREIDTTLIRFDFSEKSPDDIVKESLQPRVYKNQ